MKKGHKKLERKEATDDTEFVEQGKYFRFTWNNKPLKVLSKGVTPVRSYNKLSYYLLCTKHYCELGGTAINSHAILCTHGTIIPMEETVNKWSIAYVCGNG